MHYKERLRRLQCVLTALALSEYRLNRSTGKIIISIPKKRGAPYGNVNAVGNRGGGAPLGNLNAERHGCYTDLAYRFKMAKVEKRLLETGNYNEATIKDISEKVKDGSIKISIL